MIEVEDIQERLRNVPFQPFRLQASSGNYFHVLRPQDVVLTSENMMIGVDIDPSSDLPTRGITLALSHVVSIEPVKKNLVIPGEPGDDEGE
ncbi:MAG: hypothetical protein AAF747_11745 [Planctomycetota bacterium]